MRSIAQGRIALREALGATGGRIIRQLLTEALVLAILAGLSSLPCAFLGTRTFGDGSRNIPRLQQAGLNPAVLGFTFVVALICAVFCALAPAITLWRENPAERMKQRVAAISVAGVPVSTRSFLIIFELALSVGLLTCTGLLITVFSSCGLWIRDSRQSMSLGSMYRFREVARHGLPLSTTRS